MARSFNSATPDKLQTDTAITASRPCAYVAWVRSTGTSAVVDTILCSVDKDVENQVRQLDIRPNAGGVVRAYEHDVSADAASSTAGLATNTWGHAAAIFVSATDRRAYLNGANKGTETTSHSPTGLDRTVIGIKGRATPQWPADGAICEAAVFSLAGYAGASDSARADLFETTVLPALAKGYSPLFFPGLVHYWPLMGRSDPEIDVRGGLGLAVTSAAAYAHPRMIYPRRARTHEYTAAAPGGGPGRIIRGGLIRGGLLRGGRLVG